MDPSTEDEHTLRGNSFGLCVNVCEWGGVKGLSGITNRLFFLLVVVFASVVFVLFTCIEKDGQGMQRLFFVQHIYDLNLPHTG